MSTRGRSSRGCWTCRLRKKKCDEKRPRCEVCAALFIPCHFTEDKPAWMDNGARQSQMLTQIKREVRENAHRRPRDRSLVHDTSQAVGTGDVEESNAFQPLNEDITVPDYFRSFDLGEVSENRGAEYGCENQANVDPSDIVPMNRAEKMMIANFSEFVLPLVFPAYRPCMHDGGRAWVTDLANDSSILRRIICLQSALHSAALQNSSELDALKIKAQQMSRSVLASAVVTTQILTTKSDQERLTAAVTILISILLVQHFNTAASFYDPRLGSLTVARKVYEYLFVSHSNTHTFQDLVKLVESPILAVSEYGISFASFKYSTFKFAIGQLVFDDIIASTVLGESPHLHQSCQFLFGPDSTRPNLELESVVGCRTLTLLRIGKIAELAERKRKSKRCKTFDVIDFVGRVMAIKSSLEQDLDGLDEDADGTCCNESTSERGMLMARRAIWLRAALLYLHIVAAGFQSCHTEVQDHIISILGALEERRHDSSFLRTITWPFCVSGCLAGNMYQGRFAELFNTSRNTHMSGHTRAAHDVMKLVWSKAVAEDDIFEDFIDVFHDQSTPPMLF